MSAPFDSIPEVRPVEKKVKASTAAAAILTALLTAALALFEGDQLVEGVPDWVPVLVATLASGFATFQAGYNAPHTPRPPLPPAVR